MSKNLEPNKKIDDVYLHPYSTGIFQASEALARITSQANLSESAIEVEIKILLFGAGRGWNSGQIRTAVPVTTIPPDAGASTFSRLGRPMASPWRMTKAAGA